MSYSKIFSLFLQIKFDFLSGKIITMSSEKYISMLKDHKSGVSPLPEWQIMELLAAVKLNMVLWKDIRSVTDDKRKYPNKNYGADLISYDLNKIACVKYVDELSFKDITSFCAYCYLLREAHHEPDTIVICKPNTVLNEKYMKKIEIVRLDINEELKYI